jgi:hypothetical protein
MEEFLEGLLGLLLLPIMLLNLGAGVIGAASWLLPRSGRLDEPAISRHARPALV